VLVKRTTAESSESDRDDMGFSPESAQTGRIAAFRRERGEDAPFRSLAP